MHHRVQYISLSIVERKYISLSIVEYSTLSTVNKMLLNVTQYKN